MKTLFITLSTLILTFSVYSQEKDQYQTIECQIKDFADKKVEAFEMITNDIKTIALKNEQQTKVKILFLGPDLNIMEMREPTQAERDAYAKNPLVPGVTNLGGITISGTMMRVAGYYQQFVHYNEHFRLGCKVKKD